MEGLTYIEEIEYLYTCLLMRKKKQNVCIVFFIDKFVIQYPAKFDLE